MYAKIYLMQKLVIPSKLPLLVCHHLFPPSLNMPG